MRIGRKDTGRRPAKFTPLSGQSGFSASGPPSSWVPSPPGVTAGVPPRLSGSFPALTHVRKGETAARLSGCG